VTPGYLGEDQSDKRLAAEAKRIGFPVLIKAIAGGGGKGMRRVEGAKDFAACLAAARREAKAAFGDDRVLLETYVARPRHIEVQVFGDAHGNIVHLFERDCSVQRRHQKIIEEAPAPGLDEATRAAITGAAVKAARAVGYQNAGTIEFIADASHGLSADRIWFMEMNTRLQVEHPVTEAITGLDLVEWQLRVASGEPLPLRQDEIRITGHAVEARLYAEDPARGFLPSTGPLRHFRFPDTMRADTGYEAGDAVTRFYDPMLAKLIAHAATRGQAIAELAGACRGVQSWPVKTNAAFLARVLDQHAFRNGDIDTGFVEAHVAELTHAPQATRQIWEAAADAERRRRAPTGDDASPWAALTGFRINGPETAVTIPLHHAGSKAVVAPALSSLSAQSFGDHTVVFSEGQAYEFAAAGTRDDAAGEAGDGTVVAPMPGMTAAVHVKAGARVKRGDVLVTLEAMKMEFPVTASVDGVVTELSAAAGRQVTEGTVLARIEAANTGG
jgi:acetyl/propionyl-CoA carboxylase alpha subunit